MKKSDEKKIREAWKGLDEAVAEFSNACTRCADLPLWAFRVDTVHDVTRRIEKITTTLNQSAYDAEMLIKKLEKA
jgi:hypothetical protein